MWKGNYSEYSFITLVNRITKSWVNTEISKRNTQCAVKSYAKTRS
jgi:hypothetical protein